MAVVGESIEEVLKDRKGSAGILTSMQDADTHAQVTTVPE